MTYLGQNIPKLGFGLMRLPMLGEEVDIEQVKEMTDRFMKAGFNYFDTAYTYTGGKSEEAVRTALVDRYPRESYYLATKLPAWAAKNEKDAKSMLYTSLKRTGAGYFDFYLLHNLEGGLIKPFDDYGLWDFALQKKKEGLVRHVGFSFHDKAGVLDRLLSQHPEMEFVQLQINYADWESETIQSRKCYEVARAHKKPVIIMEPVKGGNLSDLPENVAGILEAADPNVSMSSWAIRFAASLDGIITVLSGMSDLAQMDDNLKTMSDFRPLNASEKDAVARAASAISAMPRIPCSGCGYCVEGCPQSINIPEIFDALNTELIYGNLKKAKKNYKSATSKGGRAGDCIACGQCEGVCPQHIRIIEELKKACARLE